MITKLYPNTHQSRRQARREFIKNALDKFTDKNFFAARDFIRMAEMINYGSQLPVFYKNWTAIQAPTHPAPERYATASDNENYTIAEQAAGSYLSA